MIDSTQWGLIRYYRPGDFRYPDKLHFSVVHSLDLLTARLGLKAHILSDWRPVAPERPGSQHPLGRAVDTVWPGLEALDVLKIIRDSRLFTGFGLYRNEKGAVSFHLDTRTNRDPQSPATWGAMIYRQPDPVTGATVRTTEYTSLDHIVQFITTKAKGTLTVGLFVLAGLVLWKMLGTKQ